MALLSAALLEGGVQVGKAIDDLTVFGQDTLVGVIHHQGLDERLKIPCPELILRVEAVGIDKRFPPLPVGSKANPHKPVIRVVFTKGAYTADNVGQLVLLGPGPKIEDDFAFSRN